MTVLNEIAARLADIRRSIEEERISYGEIAELQDLGPYIDPDDQELMMWAALAPEFLEN